MNKIIPVVAITLAACSSQEQTVQPCCEKNLSQNSQDVGGLLRSLGATPATKQEVCDHEDGENFCPAP